MTQPNTNTIKKNKRRRRKHPFLIALGVALLGCNRNFSYKDKNDSQEYSCCAAYALPLNTGSSYLKNTGYGNGYRHAKQRNVVWLFVQSSESTGIRLAGGERKEEMEVDLEGNGINGNHKAVVEGVEDDGMNSKNIGVVNGDGGRYSSKHYAKSQEEDVIVSMPMIRNGLKKKDVASVNGKNISSQGTSLLSSQSSLSSSVVSDATSSSPVDMKNEVLNEINELGVEDKDESSDDEDGTFSKKKERAKLKQLWRRRHAGSISEGIRRTRQDLDQILTGQKYKNIGRASRSQYVARTMTGFINALAEGAEGLEVEIESRPDTPVWDKHVDNVKVKFQRLQFRPLRVRGPTKSKDEKVGAEDSSSLKNKEQHDFVKDADEAFERIDVDNSGSLDQTEIATALSMAMGGNKRQSVPKYVFTRLAARLVKLYDVNGDKVLDREEYQIMVEDMATLQNVERIKKLRRRAQKNGSGKSIWRRLLSPIGLFNSKKDESKDYSKDDFQNVVTKGSGDEGTSITKQTPKHSPGSITFSNLKLDLRQVIFGSLPGMKYITPGGPLVLEPFTLTFKGAFDANDFMNSFLLDSGLRRLVARALNLRVRSVRDFLDGAMFYGRTWNLNSEEAPMVEVPQLTKIEFDKQDKMIITGITQIRASPDAPTIENSFKLRARIGTRMNGQVIRLEDPEIAILLTLPKAWERNIVALYKKLGIKVPTRPEPLTIFVPLIQPAKFQNKGGYDMGQDNNIRSIFIKNGALHLEMSAVITPGRFLGNHYVAFSVPQRTFIITKDRVSNGIKQARKNKLSQEELRDAEEEVDMMSELNKKYSFVEPPKPEDDTINNEQGSFFGKFIRGYTNAKLGQLENVDEWVMGDYMKVSVGEWFGRQTNSTTNSTQINVDEDYNETLMI